MNQFRFFIVSFTTHLIVSIYLFSQVSAPLQALHCVLSQFLFVSISNSILLYKINKYNICIITSPTSCFLIITQIYFTFSSLRYFADSSSFYPMFELSKNDQFVGYFISQFVVLILIFRIHKFYYVKKSIFLDWVSINYKEIVYLSFFLLILSVIAKLMLVYLGYGSTYSESLFTKLEVRKRSDAILLNINEVIDQFLIIYFILLYYIKKQHIGKFSFLSYFFLFISIGLFFYNLMFFKSRLLILYFVIIFLLIQQAYSKKNSENNISLLFIFLPVSIGIIPFLNVLLGRDNLMSDTVELLIQITSCRADLSDFAYAILLKSKFIGLDPNIAWQALLNSIPNFVFPGKDLFLVDAYSLGLEKINWQAKSESSIELIDYQDSLFSAGAMGFGILGFIFVPLIYIKTINSTAKFLHKNLKFGFNAILLFPLITSSLRLELEFSNIFINLRNSIQMIILSLIFIFILRFLLKKRNLIKV